MPSIVALSEGKTPPRLFWFSLGRLGAVLRRAIMITANAPAIKPLNTEVEGSHEEHDCRRPGGRPLG
jgi:hypothetical protein